MNSLAVTLVLARGQVTYTRQIQCAACGYWRAWSDKYEACPLCGLHLGVRDRFVLLPRELP